jgi:hypothetical protein
VQGDDGKMVGEKVGLGLAFYRAEGKGERAAEAVRWELAGAPLMAATSGLVGGSYGEGEGRETAVVSGAVFNCSMEERRGRGTAAREAARPWGGRGGRR